MNKQSNNDNLKKSEDYYDLLSNITFIRGHEGRKVEDVKFINNHPEIFPSIYSISKDGKVYCVIDDQYLKWDYVTKEPSVNLVCKEKGDGGFVRKRFLIKDLVACSYIANAYDYLERGYKVVNIDGNPNNCEYHNIIFIDPNKEY